MENIPQQHYQVCGYWRQKEWSALNLIFLSGNLYQHIMLFYK